MVKFSRFFHKYVRDNRVCCYHALTMRTVYTDVNVFSQVQASVASGDVDLQSDALRLYEELYNAKILIDDSYDEKSVLENVRKLAFHGVNIRVMVLHVTDVCNLRCKYCFIEGGQPDDYVRQAMSIDTARAAVDKFFFILSNNQRISAKPSIVFYGGEPLLNWPVIKDTLEYLDLVEAAYHINVDKVIITNGTAIQSDMIPILREHHVLVSVSLDGKEEVHDANRVDALGHGSYSRVIEGIKLLQSGGIEPAVSCVMAKNGLPYAEETVRFLVEEIGIKGLGFNHVSIIPGLNYYDENYENNFADAIIRVQELIQKSYPYVYERRMGHKVNCFIDKQLIVSDCTGCGEQMSVSPDGMIGICQGYMGSRKTFSCSVFDDDYLPSNDEIFQEWSKRSPLMMEACLSCPALATCGGGCPRNADMLHGSIWHTDSAFCHFAKKAQEWLVWQKIEDESQ